MIERRIEQFRSGEFMLTGQWDGPEGEPEQRLPGVIFCHGFTGNRFESRRMYALLSARLAAKGVRTFRFDHRGCGESEGDFRDFDADGLLEDLRNALNVFQTNPLVDQKYSAVTGYSLGGLSASYLLHKNPAFATAVMWAPVAQPDIIRDRLATHPDFPNYREKGYLDYMGFRVSAAYIDNIGALNPLEWVKTYRKPIFFAQGSEDPVVKPEQVHLYMDTRRNPEDRLLMVRDGDHFFGIAQNIDNVIDESEKWLMQHLEP